MTHNSKLYIFLSQLYLYGSPSPVYIEYSPKSDSLLLFFSKNNPNLEINLSTKLFNIV